MKFQLLSCEFISGIGKHSQKPFKMNKIQGVFPTSSGKLISKTFVVFGDQIEGLVVGQSYNTVDEATSDKHDKDALALRVIGVVKA